VPKNANPGAVLESMAKSRWVHFSCHGIVDHEEPFESYFELEGSRLRVQDIMDARLEHAEFAFLSACYSATSSGRIVDESISLTSALQLAGFRSVVGTMWTMYDPDAPHLTEGFYQNLMKHGGEYTDAAEALHHAIKKLRRPEPNSPTVINRAAVHRWAMFIHIGA
jgi:CHAT domain-containing protein